MPKQRLSAGPAEENLVFKVTHCQRAVVNDSSECYQTVENFRSIH